MAKKKRTGLQSEISAIFSGVPVPKKDGSEPQPRSSTPRPQGSDLPRPVAPQPQAPAAPTLQQPVEPLQEASLAEVPEAKVPEQRTRQIPGKVSRRRKVKLFTPKAGVSSGRNRAGLILFIILSIVLVLVLVRPFETSGHSPASSAVAGQAQVGPSSRVDIEIDWPMPLVYPAELRDPMELGSQQQVKTETIRLVVKGISYSEDRKYAVIGTETVEEGDEILGAIVVRINPNSVEFEKDGKRWTQEVEAEER